MPDIFREAEEAVFGHLWHTETPAATAAATAPTQGDEMSFTTELEDGWNALKAETVKFEQAMPNALAKAKQFEASPLGQLAVTAAEHVAAGFLPPEALAVVESGAADLYGKILSLYNPQGTQVPPAAPAQA